MTRRAARVLALAAGAAATLTAAPAARADVVEVKTLEGHLPHAEPGTLVVLDIDNTLVTTPQMLGGDAWYYHLVRRFQADAGLSEADAHARAMTLWNEVQHHTTVRPVEPETPGWVGALQARGIAVMALTARTPDIADRTLAQLAEVGIHLDQRPVHPKDLELRLTDVARYTRGVLFVGEHNDKGQVLARFLATAGLKPRRVLFADDKAKHARNVDAALAAAKVPATCLRYGAADATVAAFDGDVADVQLRFLGTILTDEAARSIVNGASKGASAR